MIRNQRELVLQVAAEYRDCGLPWDELVGEAHIGLMHAACRFDRDAEVSFACYARCWIEAALRALVLRSGSRKAPTAREGARAKFSRARFAS